MVDVMLQNMLTTRISYWIILDDQSTVILQNKSELFPMAPVMELWVKMFSVLKNSPDRVKEKF